jgi:hypothetical protein
MDESLSAGSASATVISLRIERGEPISGTLTVHGRTGEERFCGWMELIATITASSQLSIEQEGLLPDGPRTGLLRPSTPRDADGPIGEA